MTPPSHRTRGRPPTRPATRRTTVYLLPQDLDLLTLAARVRVWRERQQLAEPGPGSIVSVSREIEARVAPGLIADALGWVDDPSLPPELREEARRLTSPQQPE